MEWIPRTENERADYISRIVDTDDWAVSDIIFNQCEQMWGPHSIDRFASYFNTKIPILPQDSGIRGVKTCIYSWLVIGKQLVSSSTTSYSKSNVSYDAYKRFRNSNLPSVVLGPVLVNSVPRWTNSDSRSCRDSGNPTVSWYVYKWRGDNEQFVSQIARSAILAIRLQFWQGSELLKRFYM